MSANTLFNLKNFRDFNIVLNGRKYKIGGMAHPINYNATIKTTEIINSMIENSYNNIVSLHENNALIKDEFLKGTNNSFYEVPIKDHTAPTQDQFDEVYAKLQLANQGDDGITRIIIYCGEGWGRTGTIIASLLLREYLENNYKNNPRLFDEDANRHKYIALGNYGDNEAISSSKSTHAAIQKVRESVPLNATNGDSVEKQEQVVALMELELRVIKDYKEKNDSSFNPSNIDVEQRPQVFPRPQESSHTLPQTEQKSSEEILATLKNTNTEESLPKTLQNSRPEHQEPLHDDKIIIIDDLNASDKSTESFFKTIFNFLYTPIKWIANKIGEFIYGYDAYYGFDKIEVDSIEKDNKNEFEYIEKELIILKQIFKQKPIIYNNIVAPLKQQVPDIHNFHHRINNLYSQHENKKLNELKDIEREYAKKNSKKN